MQSSRKPVKWVGSSKRDLVAMPEDVKDVFGHAIDLAQAGGKHRDAKVLAGFGSAESGIATPQPDLDLIASRLKAARADFDAWKDQQGGSK
jgi:phage-related protein